MFNIPGLSKKMIAAIFVLKVAFGTIYGLIYLFYYGGVDVDTYNYFKDSSFLFELLFKNPKAFIDVFFWSGGAPAPDHLAVYFKPMYYWANIGDYSMVRFNVILRFISFGNYYVHVVVLNFLSLIGLLALYRLFNTSFEHKRKWIIISLFFIPSVLFWGSGLHKDGFVLLGVGMLLLNFHLLITTTFSIKQFIYLLIAIGILILFRGDMTLLLCPALAAYYLVKKYPRYAFVKFLLVYIVCGLVVLNINRIFPEIDTLEFVVDKRVEFQEKIGDSNMLMNTMMPTALSFIKNIPEAFSHILLRPKILEMNSPFKLFFGLENMALITLIILCLFFSSFKTKASKLNQAWNHPLLLLNLFYSISLLLMIGFIVNNIGAIARYKIHAMPFLMLYLFSVLDEDKLLKKMPFLKFIK